MKPLIQLIDERLEDIMKNTTSGRLQEAMKYGLLGGGKRLRPLLMLEVLAAYGISPESYVDIACSIEMVHASSLIHDDLPAMDDDDMRRGLPTVHIAYDEATAILAGDALLIDAFSVIAGHNNLTDNQKVNIIKILSDHAGSRGMVYGQMKDLESETAPIGLSELREIHAHKTGKLIEAPLMMAAVIADPDALECWRSIGHHLGTAFQIQDDVLESTSNEAMMGKSLSDQRHDKATYVRVMGIEGAQREISMHFDEVRLLLDTLPIDQSDFLALVERIEHRQK